MSYPEFVLRLRAGAVQQLARIQAVALGTGTLEDATITLAALKSAAEGLG